MRKKIRALLVSGTAALVAALVVPLGTASAGPPVAAGVPGATTASLYTEFVATGATVAPGASFTRNWKLPVGVVPEVGRSPVGASTTALCRFDSPRGWFTENNGGSVRYFWTVKKIGTIACGVTTFLTQRPKTASVTIGGLDRGATTYKTWNTRPE